MRDEERLKEQLEQFRQDFLRLQSEISRVIVGQQQVLEDCLTAMIAGGHVLLEGVPGLGKTLIVRTLAEALRLQFRRIQFTPDLMPADLTGTNVIAENRMAIEPLNFKRDRSSPTFCWQTNSTEPHLELNQRCWKRCRNILSPFPELLIDWLNRSS